MSTPKVITGPVPPDYADRPEAERLEFAAALARDLQAGLAKPE